MAVDYEKQALELYGLYNMETESGQAQCIEQAQDNPRDLAMPPHWRTWSLAFLVVFEERWPVAEKWRQEAETLYQSLPKTEADLCTIERLRGLLDHVYDWQAKKAHLWSHAAVDCDGILEGCPPAATSDGAEDDDDDGKTETDAEEHILTPSSSSDGGGESRDNLAMEEIKAAEVAKEAAAGEEVAVEEEDSAKESAKESAESSKAKEETQPGAGTADAKNEAKDTISSEPDFETGGIKADEGNREGLGLPKQQSLDAHTPEAHPSESFKAEILKLVEDRFNALVKEQRGDASKEPDGGVEVQTKASTLLQEMIIPETTEATIKLSKKTADTKDAIPQETIGAKTKLLQEATEAMAKSSGGMNKLRSNASPSERQIQERYDLRVVRSQEDYDHSRLRSQEDHDRSQLEAKEDHDHHMLELLKICAPAGGEDEPSK